MVPDQPPFARHAALRRVRHRDRLVRAGLGGERPDRRAASRGERASHASAASASLPHRNGSRSTAADASAYRSHPRPCERRTARPDLRRIGYGRPIVLQPEGLHAGPRHPARPPPKPMARSPATLATLTRRGRWAARSAKTPGPSSCPATGCWRPAGASAAFRRTAARPPKPDCWPSRAPRTGEEPTLFDDAPTFSLAPRRP